MPEFSVIIPTRQRHDTLRAALKTAVAQDHPDVEILVHECGDDPLTAQVVEEVGDHRTRHVKTGSDVPMTENWERAVACATGRYLTIIGDDDGIIPTACSEAAQILGREPSELLTWRPAAYFWPESVVRGMRNRLRSYLPRFGKIRREEPKVLLEAAYQFRTHHYTMPMMLNSFVSRDLVDRITRDLGHYFHSTAPDIASAVVDALYGQSCIRIERPLSISGLSHHSTGSRLHFTRDTTLRLEAEDAAFDELKFDPSIPNTRNSILFAANEMLNLKQQLFPDAEPAMNYVNLVQLALDSLTTGFDDYRTSLDDIRRIAALHHLDMSRFEVPDPPAEDGAASATGATAVGNSLLIDVDCSKAGHHDVSGATRLLWSLLPTLVPPGELPEPAFWACRAQWRQVV